MATPVLYVPACQLLARLRWLSPVLLALALLLLPLSRGGVRQPALAAGTDIGANTAPAIIGCIFCDGHSRSLAPQTNGIVYVDCTPAFFQPGCGETQSQRAEPAGTLRNLRITQSGNNDGFASDNSYVVYVNGVSTLIRCTTYLVPANGATCSDTTDSVVIQNGDRVNVLIGDPGLAYNPGNFTVSWSLELASSPTTPTLQGENLITNTTAGGTIGVSPIPPAGCAGASFSFHATGVTSGPYYINGTFSVTGSFTLGNLVLSFPPTYAVTAFSETFTILAPSGTATGTKTLATLPNLPNLATCGTGLVGPEVGLHSVNATYTALLNGTVNECGSNQLQLDYVYDQSNGGFNQTFLAGMCSSPGTDPPLSATGRNVGAMEGVSFSGTVATFTDPDTSATASEYAATINWGDSTTSAGTISGSGGNFSVNGTHPYAEEGTYTVKVTITDVDNTSNTATATSTAKVADASLSSSCAMPTTTTLAYAGPTATFTDQSATGTLSDFSATIAWGDSSSSNGVITGGPGNAGYTVSGSHTYTSTGPFTVTTTIKDVGGSTTTATCSKVLVFAFAPGGGAFVIGDENSAVGTAVTFWGAQWWKLNSLSGGAAPASFKGFAARPATPSCGTPWGTDPGNSAPPPAGPLPALMGVLVSSSITQSGSTISGNTPHIVVVQTNPGYASDPGHAGTGTVLAQIC